jgi:pentatricopeptide repeat protein
MISGHVKCGLGQKALEVFQQMQQEGVEPDAVTFVGVLNACASVGALDEGRQIEKQIMQLGFEYEGFVGSSLIDMYAKCGSIEDAWRVFNRMPMHNVVAWNALILGHVKYGQGHKALELFQQMQQECVEPDKVTFMGVVNACASVAALEEGRHVEQQIIQCVCDSDDFVGSSLIDMYAKCGSIGDACQVFNKMPTCDVSLGMPCFKAMPCMGMLTKPLNILKRCVKKVCASTMSLSFLFYQHVTMLAL